MAMCDIELWRSRWGVRSGYDSHSTTVGACTSTIPVFTSTRERPDTMCAYKAVMDAWPIPYQDFNVETGFGDTT